jgi:hypothetical protein
MTLGEPIAQDEAGLAGSVHLEIDVPATGDGVRLMVIDFKHEQFGELRGHRVAVFSPYRTCVSVAVAVGLALAAAELGRGGGQYLPGDGITGTGAVAAGARRWPRRAARGTW